MTEKFIIAPESVKYDLDSATSAAAAILNLVENVCQPVFDDYTFKGMLGYLESKNQCDKKQAAYIWMSENYDKLYSVVCAINVLSDRCAEILIDLPLVSTTK